MLILVTTFNAFDSVVKNDIELKKNLENHDIVIRFLSEEDFNFFVHLSSEKKTDDQVVSMDLSDEQFMFLAREAHEQNITINQLINNILRKKLQEEELKSK